MFVGCDSCRCLPAGSVGATGHGCVLTASLPLVEHGCQQLVFGGAREENVVEKPRLSRRVEVAVDELFGWTAVPMVEVSGLSDREH